MINILESGWGTGLNCILSILYNSSLNQTIEYSGIEPYPIKYGYY